VLIINEYALPFTGSFTSHILCIIFSVVSHCNVHFMCVITSYKLTMCTHLLTTLHTYADRLLCCIYCKICKYGSFHMNSTKNPDPFRFLQKLAQMLMVLRNFVVPNFGSFYLPPYELSLLYLFTKMLISCFVNNIRDILLFHWIVH